jgi:hypothetical protein
MKWLLGYLNPNDYVTFKTDISDNAEFIHYSKFIQFVIPLIKKDTKGFLECINSYYTFFIDVENHTWHLYKKEYRHATFDELITLNEKREERKKLEKETKKFGNTHLYKTTIFNIFKKSHENDFQNRNKQGTRETISSFFNRSRRNSGRS